MSKFVRLAVLLLLPVAIGCNGSPADSLVGPQVSTTLSAEGATGSTTSSGLVPLISIEATVPIRTQMPEFILHFDAQRNLIAAHLPIDICAGGTLSFIELLVVDTPSAIAQRIVHTEGDAVSVAVYEADSFADAGINGSFDTAGFNAVITGDVGKFCSFIAGPRLIAAGTVRRVSNLSNASFSVIWTGTLQTPGGDTLHLSENYQLTGSALDPADTSQWSVNTSKILLH